MRKLVICLLVVGLLAIQTVGHMNSDPAPGRSPGPPVAATTNSQVPAGDHNDTTSGSNADITEQFKHSKAAGQAGEGRAGGTAYTHQHNGDGATSYTKLAESVLDNETDFYGNRDNSNNNVEVANDATWISPLDAANAINSQLANDQNARNGQSAVNFQTDESNNAGHADIPDSGASMKAYATAEDMQQPLPPAYNQHGNFESPSSGEQTRHGGQSTSSSMPLAASSTSDDVEQSTGTASVASCHQELKDFLGDATVIDAANNEPDDTNANIKSFASSAPSFGTPTRTTTATSATTSTFPHLQIELQLEHDIFDVSSDFGISCGLLYRVHLTTTPLTLARATHTPHTQTPASEEAQRQRTLPMHYTGEFFVESVSLLQAQERGSFVSESSGNKLPISWFATSKQNANRHMKDFASNAPKSNGAARKASHADYAFRPQGYSASSSMGESSAFETWHDIVERHRGGNPPRSSGFFQEFVAAKNFPKPRQENEGAGNDYHHGASGQQANDLPPAPSMDYRRASLKSMVSGATDASASSPPLAATLAPSNGAVHSSFRATTGKQRRSSAPDDNVATCPDNKWRGTTRSTANAAGGFSTESLGLWWLNELCEQDDIIKFRVFFRIKLQNVNESKKNSSSNGNRNKSHANNNTIKQTSGNNFWDNANVANSHGQRNADVDVDDGNAAGTATSEEAQIVVYQKTFQFHIRKDCHLILRETSMGTLDYTVLPLYCIDCTVHFPNYKNLNTLDDQKPPPGLLVELQRLNVPCASGGYVRFNSHRPLCGKLEELEAADRSYHFNVGDNTTVQFYRNPMFSLSYKLVDYCYNVSNSNESAEYYVRPSFKDHLECYFRIHLPYGNRVLMRLVSNNDSEILPMARLWNEAGTPLAPDDEPSDGMYTIFSSQGTDIQAQVVNLTLSGTIAYGAYSPTVPLYKLTDFNHTLSRKPPHADGMQPKVFSASGADAYGFFAAARANLQMALSGSANCVGVVIKVFEGDHAAKWSHCVNDTRHMRGFILESSSNTLSVHLFRPPPAKKATQRPGSKELSLQMPAIYMSYQARPLTNIMSNCAFGWIAVQQFCITAIEMAMPWHEGEKYCSKLGGHLVSIRNEQQQQTINEMLIRSPGYGDENAYWVGGSDKSFEGDFRWSDGLMFQYTNWFPGWSQHGNYNKQPNDDGLSSQDCIELRRYFRTPPGIQTSRSPITNRYMWNDRDCSANNFIICERAMGDESVRRNWLNDCNKTVSLNKEHPRASIWSPSFPRQYPDNANCFTTITAPAGYRVVIEFEELVIENEPGCTYDYLEITEPLLSDSQRTPKKTSSNHHRYSRVPNTNNFYNPNGESYRKRSPYDGKLSSASSNLANGDHNYAPMNTDYNSYDLAQNNYQRLMQIYSSLYAPREDFIIQTPDYPKGNPYYQHLQQQQQQHHHRQHSTAAKTSEKRPQDITPKRLCGDWSTKLKLLRYVSSGSYLGLHFVSDYSHHFGGYKAKTYMENRSQLLEAVSECANERLKPYNGSCYLFVSYPEVDWWTAQQVCGAMGARLSSVASADEHRFIAANIRNQIDYSPQLIYWLGGELTASGEFKWLDDTKMTFQGWLPGQGQFEKLPPDGICLGLQWKISPTPMLPSGLYWQSQKCTKVGGYVCKKPKEPFAHLAFSNFTVTGTEGRIVSPGYPTPYPLNIDYWIHIQAPERTRIILQFQKIDLEPQDECLYDFISIQDYDMVSKIVLEPGENAASMAVPAMSGERFAAYEDSYGGTGAEDIKAAAFAAPATEQVSAGYSADGNNSGDEESIAANDEGVDDNETTLRSSHLSFPLLMQQYQQQLASQRFRRDIAQNAYTGRTAKGMRVQSEHENPQLHYQTVHSNVPHNIPRSQLFRKLKQGAQYVQAGRIGNQHVDGGNMGQINRIGSPAGRKHTKRDTHSRRRRATHKQSARRRKRRSTIIGRDNSPFYLNGQSFLPYVRWCGFHEANMSKFDFVSSSNQVMMNFHSDYSMAGMGFAAVWKAIDVSGCPLRTLTSREGTISSPNYPHFLLNNLNCAFVIQAPVGRRVWLEITEFDFVEDAVLEIDIGTGPFRPFQTERHINDGLFVSTKEQLRVLYRTGPRPRGSGFRAKFHTVGLMEKRERVINLTTSGLNHLYQLNYPHDMPENVDFTQHLVAPFGQNILLELREVEFADDNGCPDNNIIEVYDNYADNNGTKWQLCKLQYANSPAGSPKEDNYFGGSIRLQPAKTDYFPASVDDFRRVSNNDVVAFADAGASPGRTGASSDLETPSMDLAEFRRWQEEQQREHLLEKKQMLPFFSGPTEPPPVFITSYLNTLYIRQRTTAKAIANLNCTVSLLEDNMYKMKLASGDTSVETCQPNPCQENGKCVVNNGTSFCQCQGHFTGRFCGLDMCELDPCLYGRCELTPTNFKCICQHGYMGTTCDQKTKPCAENPCEGRGICIEKNNGFFCRCYAWWEGHRCEKRMLHIPYKPLSERMLQEPFWLGLITVFVVMAVIGLVWCAKRHFPEKIEKLLAEEAERNRPPGSVHGHHHHTSLREQLQFTTAIPQTTANNAPGAPRSIFNRLGSPSPRKKRNNSTPVKKNAAEKKQILQQLVSPAAAQAKPKLHLGELISLSENRAHSSTIDSESDHKETTFSENTGSQTSATVERAINDPKLEKKVTFARLLNKVSAEMSSGSEVDIGSMAATRNSSALSLPTDIQLRASSMPPSPCTNDIRSPHSTSSNHGSESFSSSDLALTDFGLRSIQTSGSDMASTTNHQLSGLTMGLPPRCRIGSPARPKVSSADSILAMFRNFANNTNMATGTTASSVFVSPSTTPTVSSPQDDVAADDESSSSSMHTPVSFSSGPPDSPVFYRQTTIEVPVLDVLNAHKNTSSSSSTTSSSSNLLHPPTILLEIPSSGINNKCLSPIREMPTPIPSPALTPIMPRPQRSNSPIFQEDPLSGGDYSDDDDKSDRSDAQLSEKLIIGLQREKARIDSDVETTPTDTTTTSVADLNKTSKATLSLGINHKLPMLSITPAIAAPMQTLMPPMPVITIDVEPPTPEEKQPRPRDLIIPTLTVEQPSPTKNRQPLIIFPGSPPPQRASIGETSFMFPNKQQQKRLLKQFEKPTSLDFPFAPPMITVTSNMSELESDTEPLSPAPKTGAVGGLMPPNPVGMCYLSPFAMCTRADRTISESNLSSSGYSSMASPGPSRCGSSNPLYPNEMDEPGSGHSGAGLSLHLSLMNRRKSSVLPSCKENISNGKCSGASGSSKTDRLQSHRPRSDSETFSDDIVMESNDEGIGTDHVDEKLDETRLSSRRFDMFLDDEVLIEVDEPPPCTLPSTSTMLNSAAITSSCMPQMAQLQLPSIVIQIDGCGDKTLSPVSSRSESPLSERAGMGRFSPHFYGRKDQLPFTDSDGLYDFPSSDGKGASTHSVSHQRRSSSKKRERKSSKCSAMQSPTKQQLDVPSKESLNTSSPPSSSGHVCNKHCHSHHHPCPAVTVSARKSPKRRMINRHPVASSSSSTESLNSTKELAVRPLPRRLNSPNREKRPRKQESLSEDEVADSILRRISPSIVKEEEPPKPKCKINRLRAIGIQIRFLKRLEKSIKTRERIASPSDSCPEEDNNTDDMDSPQASSPLLQPPSPSKTRLALCRQKRLPSETYGITAAEMNSSNWKGMDRSLIGDDLNSD